MRVIVRTITDRSYVTDMSADNVMALFEVFAALEGVPVLSLTMDEAIVHIARRHIVAIELDP